MIKKQRGVTLIELILVIGLISFMTVLSFAEKQAEMDNRQAVATGALLAQYNNAIRSWVSDNPNAASVTRSGSAWLKPTSCGGSSAVEYLSCNFPDATPANPIKFGRLSIASVITATGSSPNRVVRVVTETSPFTLSNGLRADLSGLAAISAAASVVQGSTPVSGTEGSFRSNPLTAAVTMVASNNASTDAWLRTDGSNTMNNNLRFKPESSEGMRQIENVSRLQNIALQTLYLGPAGGSTSAAKIVVDADQDVLGTMLVRNNRNAAVGLEVSRGNLKIAAGNADVSGSIMAGAEVKAVTNIMAGANMVAKGFIRAEESISSGDSITAAQNMNAKRFIDADNNNFYLDPSQDSTLNNLNALGSISAKGDIASNTNMKAKVFYDIDNSSYYLDLNNTSVLNSAVLKGALDVKGAAGVSGRLTADDHLHLSKAVQQGSGCSPNGLVGRDSAGRLLSCINGVWGAGGGGNFGGVYVAEGSSYCLQRNPVTNACSCPSGYSSFMIGKMESGGGSDQGTDRSYSYICQK